ncbi:ABC transporter ATP-binding protein [Aquibium sp. LZ166]|uniref:ABC transporter ATP-binding protein n=1 Tax=Aquibium pacificus TaxID=3153579 RepID=A0ABV3SFF8_9HYPH
MTAPEASLLVVLSIAGVSKEFQLKGGAKVTALASTTLDIKEGEFVSVIGPSGCGKSTLFNIIGGLLESDTGRILVDGREIRGSHKDIGMVFQEESVFPWRTVIGNVTLPLEIAGVPKKERYERAMHFVELVGLTGFENRRPSELSGGMRQRTALARTLASEPRILLMDEPFAALDEQTRMLIGDKIVQIWRELNQTTLLITHNLTEAIQLSDRVVVMSYRPGTIKQIVQIELPRPRTSEIISSEPFRRYLGQIWQDLREEATRGMIESKI